MDTEKVQVRGDSAKAEEVSEKAKVVSSETQAGSSGKTLVVKSQRERRF